MLSASCAGRPAPALRPALPVSLCTAPQSFCTLLMPQSDFIFATLQRSTRGKVFGDCFVKAVSLFFDGLSLVERWTRPNGHCRGGNRPGTALNEIEAAEEEGDNLDKEVFKDSEEPSGCMSAYCTTMQAEGHCLHSSVQQVPGCAALSVAEAHILFGDRMTSVCHGHVPLCSQEAAHLCFQGSCLLCMRSWALAAMSSVMSMVQPGCMQAPRNCTTCTFLQSFRMAICSRTA